MPVEVAGPFGELAVGPADEKKRIAVNMQDKSLTVKKSKDHQCTISFVILEEKKKIGNNFPSFYNTPISVKQKRKKIVTQIYLLK